MTNEMCTLFLLGKERVFIWHVLVYQMCELSLVTLWLYGENSYFARSVKGEMRKVSKLDRVRLHYLQDVIKNIEFGSVVLTIHNGKITQIDTTKKKRFTEATTNVK